MHAPRRLALPMLAALAVACTSESPTTPRTATAQPALSLAGASSGALHQSAVVMWHAQQMHPLGTHNSGAVPGATAELVRTANGLSYRLSSPSLIPGHAYSAPYEDVKLKPK